MNLAERMDRIIVAIMLDPKAVAQNEWMGEYSPMAQLGKQVPDVEMARYAETGEWARPLRVVAIREHAQPDWEWWEPRYDTPGRREATRLREYGIA